jgi:hypothetical protein
VYAPKSRRDDGHEWLIRIWENLPGLICIGAGVYLLVSRTVDPDSYLQTIAHGIGIYFIGKGLFILSTSQLQRSLLSTLRGIQDLGALWLGDRNRDRKD